MSALVTRMGNYSAEYYAVYLEAQASHWWFRGREAVLSALVAPLVKLTDARDLVIDVGSGPGGPTAAVFPDRRIVAVDMDLSVLQAYAGADARVVADVTALPLQPGSARILCAFDILEHLPDDSSVLRSWHKLLAQDAWLILTVPAYKALWSRHDDVNGHQRRYRASMLRRRLEEAGFHVAKITYFNTLLLPPIALFRWLERLWGGTPQRGTEGDGELDFSRRLPGPIERCFQALFSMERHWLKRWGLPAGVSICAIAQPRAASNP